MLISKPKGLHGVPAFPSFWIISGWTIDSVSNFFGSRPFWMAQKPPVSSNFYQCLLKIGILEMVYPWVYHYASHFPHYICCVQHGLKWWSSADYIISWHLPNEVAHRDGAGPRFGQGRFWTFWFGSTTSVIQLRKTNVVYIFVLVFIFLGFDQHNSRVSCKFSLSKWESGGSTLKCHGFKLESGQAIVGAMSI